ncbi:hypothetical protein GGE12_005548 [Rhizobium mongolense]|uniref:Uncharacterized protein n=1 Tax=Rhizobium mongolense TaxID=57676 RepID=A0A7W6RSD4_9HYPH|nr:hypothetical protein [Rhizobium mongolense]
MIACIHSLKAKAEGVRLTRPRSSLSTRPSRSDRGLIIGASVAFLLADSVAPLISFDTMCSGGTFYFQVRHANDFNGFTLEILACPDAIRN